jgi:prespore-specific regulator
MKTIRQDAWTAADDGKLAEVVLRHIREGSTQLAAFEECAQLLGRTAAACGYRWNACVRGQFQSAIDVAKLERKQRQHDPDARPIPPDIPPMDQQTLLSWSAVLSFLRRFRQDFALLQARVRQLEKENALSRADIERLRRDKSELLAQLRLLSDEHTVISEDYRAMVAIVERTRAQEAHAEQGTDVPADSPAQPPADPTRDGE